MNRLYASLFFVMAACCHIGAQNTPESAPKIISVDNLKVEFGDYATYYDFSFDVTYSNATSVTIGVEKEYNPYYKTIQVNESSPAHVSLKMLNKGRMTWVDISVVNENGKDSLTLELPVTTRGDHETDLSSIKKGPVKINHIDIYSLNGSFLKRIKNISELSSFHACTLLLQYYDKGNKLVRSRKINLR